MLNRLEENGLLKIFLDAGVTVGPPTCGACCGAHMGVLAKDEICISTTNRNFPGRMGHVESQTYLSSPMVAAIVLTHHTTATRWKCIDDLKPNQCILIERT